MSTWDIILIPKSIHTDDRWDSSLHLLSFHSDRKRNKNIKQWAKIWPNWLWKVPQVVREMIGLALWGYISEVNWSTECFKFWYESIETLESKNIDISIHSQNYMFISVYEWLGAYLKNDLEQDLEIVRIIRSYVWNPVKICQGFHFWNQIELKISPKKIQIFNQVFLYFALCNIWPHIGTLFSLQILPKSD